MRVLTPVSAKDPAFHDDLRELAPDACPVVAYGALLPRAALDIPRHGWVNLHFSLLPAWRGAAPVQRAVMAGDDVTGASTFLIEEGLDTGPVLGTMTETHPAHGHRGRPAGSAGGRRVPGCSWPRWTVSRTARWSRNLNRPKVFRSRRRSPSRTRASTGPGRRSSSTVWFAGCTPNPGAWTTFRGERVKVEPVTPAAESAEGAPGTLLVTKRDVHVATGSGSVRLGLVQGRGKTPMPAADWARGVRVEPGERFGDA